MSSHAYNRQHTPLPFHIYRAYDRRDVLRYIGITTSIERRSREHNWGRGGYWKGEVTRLESRFVGPQVVARAAEAMAIRDERPMENVCLPDPREAAYRLRTYMECEGLSVADVAASSGFDGSIVYGWLLPEGKDWLPPWREHANST